MSRIDLILQTVVEVRGIEVEYRRNWLIFFHHEWKKKKKMVSLVCLLVNPIQRRFEHYPDSRYSPIMRGHASQSVWQLFWTTGINFFSSICSFLQVFCGSNFHFTIKRTNNSSSEPTLQLLETRKTTLPSAFKASSAITSSKTHRKIPSNRLANSEQRSRHQNPRFLPDFFADPEIPSSTSSHSPFKGPLF